MIGPRRDFRAESKWRAGERGSRKKISKYVHREIIEEIEGDTSLPNPARKEHRRGGKKLKKERDGRGRI